MDPPAGARADSRPRQSPLAPSSLHRAARPFLLPTRCQLPTPPLPPRPRYAAQEGAAMEKGAGTRRRQLVERASDRLGFITGQACSLSCHSIPVIYQDMDVQWRSQRASTCYCKRSGNQEANKIDFVLPSDLTDLAASVSR